MLRRLSNLSFISTLFLGCIIACSILLIHSMLIAERHRIELLEKQILVHQKQWNDAWMDARKEDMARFSEQTEKIAAEFEKIKSLHAESMRLRELLGEETETVEKRKYPPYPAEPNLNKIQPVDEHVDEQSKIENHFNSEMNEAVEKHNAEALLAAAAPPVDEHSVEHADSFDPAVFADREEAIKLRKTRRHNAPRAKHFPKVIIIGVKKCGTTALSRYMHMHPDLSTASETYFFVKDYQKGLDFYKSLMPETTDDVITYEKTPSYYRLPVVPDRIRNFNSTIKIIMVTCDPVRRLLSDFYHQHRHDPTPVQPGDFEKQFSKRLTQMENDLIDIQSTFHEDWFEQVYRMYKARSNWFNFTDIESNLIINGAYGIYRRRWLESFDASQLFIVDGTDLLDNPAQWMIKVQNFLGLEQLVDDRNFIFDEERGNFCFIRPYDKKKYCLSETKGRTNTKTMSIPFCARLHKFFQPFTTHFAKDMGLPGFNWTWKPEISV